MITERQHERCARRAAELLAANDIVLRDLPLPSTLLAALEPAIRVAISEVAHANAVNPATLCIITAYSAATNGSLVCTEQSALCVSSAQSLGIPVYVLLAGGPDAGIHTAEALHIPPNHVQLEAEQISAFITDRGIYRPAMLARHIQDGDTPIDVIPLIG
jgi:hypothetical protein